MCGLVARTVLVSSVAVVVCTAADHGQHARGVDLGHVPRRQQAPEGLSFVVMGDWGGRPGDGCSPNSTCGGDSDVGPTPWTSHAQVATAAGMGQVAQSLGSEFALALGDNFYFSGISVTCYKEGHHANSTCVNPSSNNRSDVFSARFNDTFEDVFTAPHLQANNGFAFYVLGGESWSASHTHAHLQRFTNFHGGLPTLARQPRSLREHVSTNRVFDAKPTMGVSFVLLHLDEAC